MPRKQRRRIFKLPTRAVLNSDDPNEEVVEHLALLLGHVVFVASLCVIILPVIAYLLGYEHTALAGISARA